MAQVACGCRLDTAMELMQKQVWTMVEAPGSSGDRRAVLGGASGRWRRVVLRLKLVIEGARLQAMLLELQHIEPKKESVQTVEQPPLVKSYDIILRKADILQRPQVEMSESVHNTWKHPGVCRHEELKARGNGSMLWWTCSSCGCRWPREKGEHVQ